MWQAFGALTTARAREFCTCWRQAIKEDAGLLTFEWIFRTFRLTMKDFGNKMEENVVQCWPPNELVLTFWGFYVCANFGENRSRNATVRVLADGHTLTRTQIGFIICPMPYAIAMGQITSQHLVERIPLRYHTEIGTVSLPSFRRAGLDGCPKWSPNFSARYLWLWLNKLLYVMYLCTNVGP